MLFLSIVNKLTATLKNLLVSEERIYVKLMGYKLYKWRTGRISLEAKEIAIAQDTFFLSDRPMPRKRGVFWL